MQEVFNNLDSMNLLLFRQHFPNFPPLEIGSQSVGDGNLLQPILLPLRFPAFVLSCSGVRPYRVQVHRKELGAGTAKQLSASAFKVFSWTLVDLCKGEHVLGVVLTSQSLPLMPPSFPGLLVDFNRTVSLQFRSLHGL